MPPKTEKLEASLAVTSVMLPCIVPIGNFKAFKLIACGKLGKKFPHHLSNACSGDLHEIQCFVIGNGDTKPLESIISAWGGSKSENDPAYMYAKGRLMTLKLMMFVWKKGVYFASVWRLSWTHRSAPSSDMCIPNANTGPQNVHVQKHIAPLAELGIVYENDTKKCTQHVASCSL